MSGSAWTVINLVTIAMVLVAVAGVVVLVLLAIMNRRAAERLDAELTAYVSEGSMSADMAKSILRTSATTGRKREVAALIAGGMDPREGMMLLESMAAA